MKKSIRAISALMALLTAVSLAACGGVNGDSDGAQLKPEEKYEIPVFDESLRVEIGGYGSPNRFAATEQGIKDFADAGFTVLGPNPLFIDFKTRPEMSLQFLDWAQKYGIKVNVADTGIIDKTNYSAPIDTTMVDMYKDHPAFYRFYIYDEPRSDVLLDSVFKEKVSQIKELFPDKGMDINLLPMGSNLGAGVNYDMYVDYLVDLDTNFLSFDMYPMRLDGSLYNTYYANLEKIRYTAYDNDMEAHNFIQAMGHASIAKTSVEMLRWQMHNNIAYGYDSWTHYCYEAWHQDEEGDQLYSYNGEKLPLYYRLQEVNLEMHKWGYVYKNFDWKFTAALDGANGKTTPLFSPLMRTARDLNDAEGIENLESDEPVLVGVFDDSNQNDAFMIVNASDPREDVWTTFTPEFSDRYSGVMVWEKGESYVLDLEDGKTTLELEPGEGKFLIPLKAKK